MAGRKKWIAKRITISLSQVEAERLELFCQQQGREATDVMRECVRNLKLQPSPNQLLIKESGEKFSELGI